MAKLWRERTLEPKPQPYPVFIPVYRDPPPVRPYPWEPPYGTPMCDDRDMFRVNPDHLPIYSTCLS